MISAQLSREMFPGSFVFDAANNVSRHMKFACDVLYSMDIFKFLDHSKCLLLGQDTVHMILSSWGSLWLLNIEAHSDSAHVLKTRIFPTSLLDTVLHIFFLCCKEKMVWVETGGIVTSVGYEQISRIRSLCKHPHDPCRSEIFSDLVPSHYSVAVSKGRSSTGPNPTSFWVCFIDSRKEPLQFYLGKLRDRVILRMSHLASYTGDLVEPFRAITRIGSFYYRPFSHDIGATV